MTLLSGCQKESKKLSFQLKGNAFQLEYNDRFYPYSPRTVTLNFTSGNTVIITAQTRYSPFTSGTVSYSVNDSRRQFYIDGQDWYLVVDVNKDNTVWYDQTKHYNVTKL